MAHTMSMEVHSAKAATHAVNFHVLPSTGVWSSCRMEIEKRDQSVKLVMFYLHVHIQ